jgi:sialic acid synthase
MFSLQKSDLPYFIAEVGQNHQGDVRLALEYVDRFQAAGASAVKFQKRNNRYLFSEAAYEAPYTSENAFGATYGEHREALELSAAEMARVRDHCAERGVDFICTPFDPPSLDELLEIGVDALKVASFDLGNVPLLQLMGESTVPIVISTGGGAPRHLDVSIKTLRQFHDDIAVLHCVSKYPCEADDLGLLAIPALQERFPELTVGLSDHFNGILSGPLAASLGASVFEKHVTLNRAWKGTDHSFALEAEGFRKFVRDTLRTREMLQEAKASDGGEPVFQKLGKSVVAARDLDAGHVLKSASIRGLILQDNEIPIRESFWLIGRTLVEGLKSGEPLSWEMVGGEPPELLGPQHP